MSEVSISLEETNAIRQKLGLPLIPLPEKESLKNGTQNQQPNASSSSSVAISIQETNKIRAKLGLSLIPLPNKGGEDGNVRTDMDGSEVEVANYERIRNEEEKSKRLDRIREKVLESKDNKKKNELLQKGSILDRLNGKEDENKSDDVDDDDEWLNNIGKSKTVFIKKLRQNTDKNGEEEEEGESININHNLRDLRNLDDANPDGVVLTLKDTNILDDDNNEEEGDQFENQELVNKMKVQEDLKNKNKGFNKRVIEEDLLNEDDEDEIKEGKVKVVNGMAIPVGESEALEDKPKPKKKLITFDADEDDDDTERNDYEPAKPIKMKKIKKKSKKSEKSTKRTRIEDEDEGEQAEESPKELKFVELAQDDDLMGEGDDYHDFINLNRIKRQKINKTGGTRDFQLILDESDHEKDKDQGDNRDEDTMDLDFLENIRLEKKDKKVQNKERGEEVKEQGSISRKITDDEDDEDSRSMDKDNAMVTSNDVQKEINKSDDPSASNQDLKEKLSGILYDTQKSNDSYSISDTLKLLQSTSRKEKIVGGDKIKNENAPADKNKEIKIRYTDDQGRELNTKEAFKYLSHKFHGHNKK